MSAFPAPPVGEDFSGPDAAGRIRKVTPHPLRVVLPKAQRTSQGDYPAIEILVVEIETETGIIGIGEGLARRGARGYAALASRRRLAPRLIGQDARDRRRLWRRMRGALTGRPGGQLVEAIAAVDIALWDIAGKIAGEPIHSCSAAWGVRT